MKKQKLKVKNELGITLIALVITIIVLLILAGVTINLTLGDNGIFKVAEQAARNYKEAENKEIYNMSEFENTLSEVISQTTSPIDINKLQAGDYVKYDSGENGIIMCRVLYPATSKYGLQIISNTSVKKITAGVSGDLITSKNGYDNAISYLNSEAEKYINPQYAIDARCVGTNPENKQEENEGPVNLKFNYNENTIFQTKGADNNFQYDKAAMQKAGIWITGERYWIASRTIANEETSCNFYVFYATEQGELWGYIFYTLYSDKDGVGIASPEYGLRPCIQLRKDIKVLSGDGKSEQTAYILGR